MPPPKTLTETTLPWKRDNQREDGSVESDYVQRQQEFPSWIENQDYLIHGSPTNTLISRLGSATKRVSVPAVFDIFVDADRPRLSNMRDSTIRRSITCDDVEDRLKTTRINIDTVPPKDVVIEIKINGQPPTKTAVNGEISDSEELESQATRL